MEGAAQFLRKLATILFVSIYKQGMAVQQQLPKYKAGQYITILKTQQSTYVRIYVNKCRTNKTTNLHEEWGRTCIITCYIYPLTMWERAA